MKTGKTSTAVLWPKPLLLATEKGYNALVGVRAADITSWADIKQICRQLKKPEAKEAYSTIIVDTVALAYSLCEKYILAREGVQAIGDIGYGKGWTMLKDEFETTFRELTQLGYALVFIAHAKTRDGEFTDEEGNAIKTTMPDLPNACFQIINRMVDLIGYLGIEYNPQTGESKRYIYTRGTPTIFAGSRFHYLAPRIELGYQNLVDAISDAMEKEANATGSVISDSGNLAMPSKVNRPFEETMAEAKSLWMKISDTMGEAGLEKAMKIINKVFGRDFQLSKAQPEQQDLVEVVIDELKDLVF